MFSFVPEPIVEALPESPGTVTLLAVEGGPVVLDELEGESSPAGEEGIGVFCI